MDNDKYMTYDINEKALDDNHNLLALTIQLTFISFILYLWVVRYGGVMEQNGASVDSTGGEGNDTDIRI
eukprot:scaffold89988_cov47-Cyclotella_meneghiniana.AAC.1